jgi:hypothetical protein
VPEKGGKAKALVAALREEADFTGVAPREAGTPTFEENVGRR